MKYTPLGSKLLVLPKEKENFKTESGLEMIQNELLEAEVIEVSEEFGDYFKPGDIVLHSSGAGIIEFYNGQTCMWIDGRSVNSGGDVWAIVIDDKLRDL